MYGIFLSQQDQDTNRRDHRQVRLGEKQAKRSQGLQNAQGTNLTEGKASLKLVRSYSRDSYSTFTTAAETNTCSIPSQFSCSTKSSNGFPSEITIISTSTTRSRHNDHQLRQSQSWAPSRDEVLARSSYCDEFENLVLDIDKQKRKKPSKRSSPGLKGRRVEVIGLPTTPKTACRSNAQAKPDDESMDYLRPPTRTRAKK